MINIKKKKAVGAATPTALVKHFDPHDTSAPNQHAIILAALKTEPKTTIELQHNFNVMAPAPRISELRKKGHKIDTTKIRAQTPDGVWHKKVAQYTLHYKPPADNFNNSEFSCPLTSTINTG